MRNGFNAIPIDEYTALYRVYLACLDARLRLPKRVNDTMKDVKRAYAAQGADEAGHTAGPDNGAHVSTRAPHLTAATNT
jgi:hypothetical protein